MYLIMLTESVSRWRLVPVLRVTTSLSQGGKVWRLVERKEAMVGP